MAKSLESWEREDLVAALSALIEALRQSLPAERVNVKRQVALVNTRHDLEQLVRRLGGRVPPEALSCCGRLDDLLATYDYSRNRDRWESEVGEIVRTLVDLRDGIAPKQCEQ